MPIITTTATFMDEDAERYGKATAKQVATALVGQAIGSVEKAGDNSITFHFVSGKSMTLTSSGLEGDDLDLMITN